MTWQGPRALPFLLREEGADILPALTRVKQMKNKLDTK